MKKTYTLKEIAAELSCSTDTLHRKLKVFKPLWKNFLPNKRKRMFTPEERLLILNFIPTVKDKRKKTDLSSKNMT
jgi:hypothetical protein